MMGLFKKNKKKAEVKKEEQVKKEVKKDNQGFVEGEDKVMNSNGIIIEVYRQFGTIPTLATEIRAEEKKDQNNNLFAINEKIKFKEDIDFSIDRVYELINLELRLDKKKRKKDKINVLNKEIKKQKNLIEEIAGDVQKNEEYNAPDERLKLEQLNILKESKKKKDSMGSYFVLKKGVRVYRFTAIDGILYPRWEGATKYRSHPDLTVKKKIFNHETAIFQKEQAISSKMLNLLFVAVWALAIILTIGNIFWAFHTWKTSQEINMDLNKGTQSCVNACTSALQKCTMDKVGLQKQLDNTNTNTKPSEIKIDPNKLIPGIGG